MQKYIFLILNTIASVPATFGAPVPSTPGFTAPIVYISGSLSCSPILTPSITGAIVLVDTTNCSFSIQAGRVQDAGGKAMVAVHAIGYIPNLVVNANAYIPAVCSLLSAQTRKHATARNMLLYLHALTACAARSVSHASHASHAPPTLPNTTTSIILM
jgi:hypothetical protein